MPSRRYSRIRSSSLQLVMNSTVLMSPESENLVNSRSFCMKMGKTNSTSSFELTGITILMSMTSLYRMLKKYSRSLAILSLFLVCMLMYHAMLLLKKRDFSVRYYKQRSPRSPRIQSLKLPSLMLFSARTARNSWHCSSSWTRNITVSSFWWIDPKERTTILNLSLMMCTFCRRDESDNIPGHYSGRIRRPAVGRVRVGMSLQLLIMRQQSSSMLWSAVSWSQRQLTEAIRPTLPPLEASSSNLMSLSCLAQQAMKMAASNSSLKIVTGQQARLKVSRNCCSLSLNWMLLSELLRQQMLC